MEIPQQIIPTKQPKKTYSKENVASVIAANGWKREVAGEHDFGLAVAGITEALSCGRGILLSGAAGVGKTMLMRAVMIALRSEPTRLLYCKDAKCIGWMKDSPDFYMSTNVFVDDIGSEDFVKEYGATIDVVGDFIQNYHMRGRGMFFCTTNLSSQELTNKYGGRVLDRLLEMCVCISFSGKSKRERKVFR